VSAGLIPGWVGIYSIGVSVPAIPANDATPLAFTLGGVAGQQALYIAIGN
jgi:uncharacterized protein (TIGR03437 family)